MSQNMILASPVLSDAATLTGNTGAGDFGLSNLQKQSMKQFYRVIGNTIALQIDLLSPQAINLVSLIGHSLSVNATIRVRAGSTNLIGSAAYDTGVLPGRSDQTTVGVASGYALTKNTFLSFTNTAQTYRYWFIDIVDTSASYIDIGRLYIAKAFQPKINMDYGLAESIIDPSKATRSVSGDRIPREFVKYRAAEFTLGYLSKYEARGDIFTLENMCGITRDVLFVIDPDEKDLLQRTIYYGNMVTIQPRVAFQYSLFSHAFRIEELPA